MSADETINGLAASISELSTSFTKTLADANIPEPNFTASSPISYETITPEIFLRRQQLLDKITDLWYLVQGPSESIFNHVHTCMPDIMALNLLNHFDFWSAVPVEGSASISDITRHVKLPEEVVLRAIDHATTLRIFEQDGTTIRHTSRSAALAKDSGLRALVAAVLNDAGPAMLDAVNPALEKYSLGQPSLTTDMTKTAYALHQAGGTIGGYKTSWEMLEKEGEGERKGYRQRNFVEFMRYLKQIFRLETVLQDSFDWKSAGDAVVVDLGGSGGHDAFGLAEKNANLRIMVQDLPEAQASFTKHHPVALGDRVTFMPHNFFDPQPLQADIYLLKLVLHDWPDEECAKILRSLVPALKPGARVFLLDFVGTLNTGDETAPRSIRQMGTATDLRMLAIFNCKERLPEGYKALFAAADERFDVVRFEANPLSFFVVIEAVWK